MPKKEEGGREGSSRGGFDGITVNISLLHSTHTDTQPETMFLDTFVHILVTALTPGLLGSLSSHHSRLHAQVAGTGAVEWAT